ncbi:peroxisomal membrane protein 11C isoform X3 [Podarcis muralis]
MPPKGTAAIPGSGEDSRGCWALCPRSEALLGVARGERMNPDKTEAGVRQEEDPAVRWLSVASNVADQLYYPCEHLAWAADAKVIRGDSGKWWVLSTLLWATSLLLGIARSLRILCQLRRRRPKQASKDSLRRARVRARAEALTVAGNLADLCNAVHWLPPGVLWAGRFPPWFVGLLGTTSSLIGVYQTYAGGAA